ncbi:mechanosensitive ion channel family protein [Microbulbifer yueqingensis]|uniref:Small-conductance mechanosensitive channel n=1 Tax=Microbulbifer yueqingensis TaxID=658219 RepID=A0A1G9BCD3_9GAMM|nr:mechanosensitive ion channel domain-containing protein [Microbulbifer yueqingensis]SDK37222.1 small conductance mechanosensitive channel [Microbulbifer yueqingensis]
MDFNQLVDEYWPQLMALAINIAEAILVLVVTFIAARLTRRGVRRLSGRLDATLIPVLANMAVWAVYIVGLLVILDRFGVNTTSLVALLGAAGIAVGLALKDTLQNIAAGFIVLGLRPFRVGDFIQFGDTLGTVREVGLFTTQLDTVDGLYISAPNANVWGQTLTNFSRNPTRRIEIVASIAYGDSIGTGIRVLQQLVAEDERILPEPQPAFAVRALADSSVNLHLRAWTRTDQYWDVYWSLMEKLKPALEAEGLTIPFPQRELHIVNQPAKLPQEKTEHE